MLLIILSGDFAGMCTAQTLNEVKSPAVNGFVPTITCCWAVPRNCGPLWRDVSLIALGGVSAALWSVGTPLQVKDTGFYWLSGPDYNFLWLCLYYRSK